MGSQSFGLAPKLLVSHAYAGAPGGPTEKFILRMSQVTDILLDSGAFTAFTQGVEITVDDYCERLERLGEHVWQYITLDVVENREQTRINLAEMRRRGFSPMAVFTLDEEYAAVPELIDGNLHLCVAGGVSQPTDWYSARIEKVWRTSGKKALLHGLGYTRGAAPLRSRVHSIDSSTWAVGSRYGNVTIYSPATATLRQRNWRRLVERKPVSEWPKGLASLVMSSGIRKKDLQNANSGGEKSLVSLLTYYAWTQYAREAWRRGIRMFFAGANPNNFLQLMIVWRCTTQKSFDFSAVQKLQTRVAPYLERKDYLGAAQEVLDGP